MKRKTRHQMYVKPNTKVKAMKMQEDMHDMMEDMCDMDDMEDMCDMDDMDDMDDMCDMDDMDEEMEDCEMMPMHKKMGGMKIVCGKVPECTMLAHAYVPWQCYEKAFTPPEALMKGTLFPELWGVYRIPK